MMECEADTNQINIETSVANDGNNNPESEIPAKRPRRIRSSFNVRMEHRRRLTRLLKKLIRQHNWKEASGVMSVLLKATYGERCPWMNRNKYWAAMELLNKLDNRLNSIAKVKPIYETWMKKNGEMKNWPAQDKFLFQIEFYLYSLTHGSTKEVEMTRIKEAEMAIRYLVNEKDFEKEPISNMFAGMIYYQLWYSSSIPEEMRLGRFDTYDRPSISEMSGMDSYNEFGKLDDHNSVDVQNMNSIGQRDSNSSIANDKKLDMEIDDVLHIEETNQPSQPQGFYMEDYSGMSGNEEAAFPNQGDNFMNTSIFYSHGLSTSLLPMRLPNPSENLEEYVHLHRERLNNDYHNAVKHLRCALYSTRPVFASLLPLIQLLLLGDLVTEALEELENIRQRWAAVLPLRLKALLLEGFYSKNSPVLSICYEDILQKDPTCSDSLNNLISMYKNGDYSFKPLLDMIALHLDATYAPGSIWGEFASCFLQLSQFEEDRISVNNNAMEYGEGNQGVSSMVIEEFIQGRLGKLWKVRCRWWSTRHFSKNAYLSEMQAGDLELLTFKAACASHLYGPEFEYVKNVNACLDKEENKDLMSLLHMHLRSSIKLFEKIN